MITVRLHPALDREPDYVIESPAELAWWERERFVGGSVLVQYGDLLEMLEQEPENVALRDALLAGESFTLASLGRTA